MVTKVKTVMSRTQPIDWFGYKMERTRPLRFIICMLIALLFCQFALNYTATAATYYIDAVNGDNNNTGTSESTPWRTLSKAQSVVTNGDTVRLQNGNYGAFNLTNYSNSNWITYEATTGHSPVFTGIYIYNPSNQNVYLKFDGIRIEQTNPNLDPNDPPWPHTFPVFIQRSNYVEIKNAVIRGWSRYLADDGVRIDESNNITIDHCEITEVWSGVTQLSGSNITVKWCNIHDICGSAIRTHGANGEVNLMIEGNHLHGDGYDYNYAAPFFPPDQLFLDSGVYPYGSPPAFVTNEEIWQPDSGTPAAKGRVMVTKWNSDYGCYKVYLRMITSSGTFRSGTACKSQTSEITFTPTDTYEGGHGGSLIACRASNTTIRKNVLHNWGGQGIKFYLEGFGFRNMKVENNLLYDIVNGSDFDQINGPCIIRNNTFIGFLDNNSLSRSDMPQRYSGSPIGVSFLAGFNGEGVKIYNNIIVGYCPLSNINNNPRCRHLENNNICWARTDFHNTTKGEKSLVVIWREDGPNYSPRGWPNYFENIGYDTSINNGRTGPCVETTGVPPYDYDYVRDGITPFFVSPGFLFNPYKHAQGFDTDRGKTFDYHLAAGSPGINFGDAANQPSDSLGSVGADGFIRNDGPARDSRHHSVGCYEFPMLAKCKVKAGKTQGKDANDINNIKDAFKASGTLHDLSADLNDINHIDVNIISLTDDRVIYSETINDFNAYYDPVRNRFNYSYRTPKYTAGAITSLKMDFNRNTFAIKAKNVDLTGLRSPLQLDLGLGDNILSGEADETIINGRRRRIPTRLMRLYEDTLIVTKARAKAGTSPFSDSLFVKGDIAVADMDLDVNEPKLTAEDVTLTWGNASGTYVQAFTIPIGSFIAVASHKRNYYKCSKVDVDPDKDPDVNEGLVTTKIDLDKCTFAVSIKNANGLYVGPGDAKFGISFDTPSGTFDETDEWTIE